MASNPPRSLHLWHSKNRLLPVGTSTSKLIDSTVRYSLHIFLYYINTSSEIPSELSHKRPIFTCGNNMLSSHVKRSLSLWLHKNPNFFTGVKLNIINRILHACLWIWILSSCVEHSKIKLISTHGHVKYSMSPTQVTKLHEKVLSVHFSDFYKLIGLWHFFGANCTYLIHFCGWLAKHYLKNVFLGSVK